MNKLNINGEFIKGNNLDLDLSTDFDLVFIDTLHIYGQLKRELEKFSNIATKYIILHDTTVDADKGEVIRLALDINSIIEQTSFKKEEIVKGLWPAVEEFLNENNDRDHPVIDNLKMNLFATLSEFMYSFFCVQRHQSLGDQMTKHKFLIQLATTNQLKVTSIALAPST